MECPVCSAEVPESLARCRFCQASIAEAAARRFQEAASARAEAAAGRDPDEVYPPHMRVHRPAAATAAGAVPPPRQRAPPPRVLAPPAPPGAGTALASVVCSILGALLLTSCFGAVLSPVPLAIGAILGYVALRQLPADAERRLWSQARFGLWVGVVGSGISLLLIVMFFVFLALSVMEGVSAA